MAVWHSERLFELKHYFEHLFQHKISADGSELQLSVFLLWQHTFPLFPTESPNAKQYNVVYRTFQRNSIVCLTKGTFSPLFSLPAVGLLFPVAQQCEGCLAFCRKSLPLLLLCAALQSWPSGFPTVFLHSPPDHSEHFYFLAKLAEFTTIERCHGISVVWLSCIQGYQLSLSKDPGAGVFHVPTEQVVLNFHLWPIFHHITTALSWDASYIAETWLPELYH